MAGGTIARTPHFALHRLLLADGAAAAAASPSDPATGPGSLPPQEPQALFGMPAVWLGALVPKRWARRAVTRNAIRRQIHAVAHEYEAGLAPAAHVVRLRAAFDRTEFVSARSERLRLALREELHQLFRRGTAAPKG